MNPLIQEMSKLAAETSAKLEGQYVDITLSVTCMRGNPVCVKFTGYTESGGHTQPSETLGVVALTLMPKKEALAAKIKELRDQASKLEALSEGVK